MENPFYFYQGVLHISFDRNWVLYHSPVGYYYELYRKSGEEWKQVFVEHLPVPHVKDAVLPETPMGICSADFGADCVYLLFSGRTLKEDAQEAFLASHILVVNKEGKKIKSLETDRLNLSISVDEKRKRIYAIGKNPENGEYEVGYYSYN